MGMTELDRKLQARMLLGARVEGDRLMLDDVVLTAALDGSRPLTIGERAALQASPLTLRRFKALADTLRRAAAPAWSGSHGLLRAADSAGQFAALQTDDGMWRLHVVDSGGKLAVILQLDPHVPGAAQVLASKIEITVRDGAKAVVIRGSLDADGECEGPWPFATTPAAHFQQHGARFDVMPSA